MQKIKIDRSGKFAATFIFGVIAYILLCPSSVNALSLPNITVDVALSKAVAQPLSSVTQPVSKAVRAITQPLTNTLTNDVPSVTNPTPAQQTPSGGSPITTTSDVSPASTSTKRTKASASPSSSTHQQTPPKSRPFFASVANFLSDVPSNLRGLVSGLIGKDIQSLPLIVSIIIFLMTAGFIGAIVYASNRDGILTLGRFGTINLSRFVVARDYSQIATLAVGTFCLGTVAIFLALAGL